MTYDYPTAGETEWGPDATDWAAAVTNGMLQKAGGLFQLLAEVDLGTSFGIKSVYFKSRTSNIADSGILRLARTDQIAWRNQANSANLALSVDASDNLLFNGAPIGGFTVADTDSIDLTFSASILSADLNLSAASADSGFINAVNSVESDGLQTQVPIADTSTTGVISSTDWNTFNGKQAAGSYITSLTGDVVAAGPGAAAASIQDGVIVNSMISGSAGIAFAKLASLASANILVGSAGNVPTAQAITGDISLTNGGVTAYAGTVPLNKGGTGQTTKAPAFDALSPMTTSGDLIYGDASGTGTRLGVGTNGYLLTVSGGLPSWQPAGALVVASKTTTFTASAAEDVYLCSTAGGAYTATLPTAVGISGKVFQFKKTTNDFTVLTIDGDGSETIDGATSTTLNTLNEVLIIVSDGSNWQILDRRIPMVRVSYTPTFTAFGTVSGVSVFWWREGTNLIAEGIFISGISTASEARMSFPSGLTSSSTLPTLSYAGPGGSTVAATASVNLLREPSVTYFTFGAQNASNAGIAKALGSTMLANTQGMSFRAAVPIQGWNG